MKPQLLAGAAAAALLAATGAFAQDSGWYGAIDLGAHQIRPFETVASGEEPQGLNFRTNINFAGFARLGYRISPHVRVELEGGYRRSGNFSSAHDTDQPPLGDGFDLCAVGSAPGQCDRPDGSLDAWTGMANLLIDVLPNAILDPFVGGGVGVNYIRLRADGAININGDNTADTLSIHDSNTKFAYQGIAGVAFRASERLNVDLTYRYIDGQRAGFKSVATGTFQPGTFSAHYRDQSLTLGLR
nr:porin family protein [Caulobacteraceae bacterium]